MEKEKNRGYTFGVLLDGWLIEHKISQSRLAELISVQPHTISRIRRDIHFPNRMTFNAIVNVFAPSGDNRETWIKEQRAIYESMKMVSDNKWGKKK